jgi:hypothetical protein
MQPKPSQALDPDPKNRKTGESDEKKSTIKHGGGSL